MSANHDEHDERNEIEEATVASPPVDEDWWTPMEAMGFSKTIRPDGTVDLYLPSGEQFGQIPPDAPYLQSGDDGQGWNANQLGVRERHAAAMAQPPSEPSQKPD